MDEMAMKKRATAEMAKNVIMSPFVKDWSIKGSYE